MNRRLAKRLSPLVVIAFFLALAAPAFGQSQVPAGTVFAVELRTRLDAKRVEEGKKFEARTLEPLEATDGSIIPAGAKVRGHVGHVKDKEMILRFEKIKTRRGWTPFVASVTRVLGEKDVKDRAGDEGEIRASGGKGRAAGVGAAVGAGVGAVVGGIVGGGKGAAIGAASGGGGGAVIGAAVGGNSLILEKGVRMELVLDRPLYLHARG